MPRLVGNNQLNLDPEDCQPHKGIDFYASCMSSGLDGASSRLYCPVAALQSLTAELTLSSSRQRTEPLHQSPKPGPNYNGTLRIVSWYFAKPVSVCTSKYHWRRRGIGWSRLADREVVEIFEIRWQENQTIMALPPGRCASKSMSPHQVSAS